MGEDVHCYIYGGSVVSWIISFFSVFIVADYLVSMLYIILSSYLFYPCYTRAGSSRGWGSVHQRHVPAAAAAVAAAATETPELVRLLPSGKRRPQLCQRVSQP